MKRTNRNTRTLLRGFAAAALMLLSVGCAPGTVYVGVAAPGPWMGYPPGGVYRGYPGVYGRPIYAPDQEQLSEIEAPGNPEPDKPKKTKSRNGAGGSKKRSMRSG